MSVFPRFFQVTTQAAVLSVIASQSAGQSVVASALEPVFNDIVLCAVNEKKEALLFEVDHWIAADSDYFSLEGTYIFDAFNASVIGEGVEEVLEGVIGHCRYHVEYEGRTQSYVTDAFPTSMTGTHAQLRLQVGQ
tara:strand:- start:344 stop:748 length:405 start_codon:yes stop_codon:yes gene_type:complete